jgi:Zn-dependent peptidase ImmA (M78 family)
LNDLYGFYRHFRNIQRAAWQALIDNNVTKLPVDIFQIVRNNGIIPLKNCLVNALRSGDSGMLVFDEGWIIIYDETNSIERIRFTIAHEYGHIVLGHPLVVFHSRGVNKQRPQKESDADIFASRFLAPACVLMGLGIRSAEDIAKVCKISLEAATIRAERMAELYKRDKWFTDPLEREVYEQFKNFIEEYKKTPG